MGGVETYLRDLLPALRERGHAVALLSSSPVSWSEAAIVPPDITAWSFSSEDRAKTIRALESWAPDIAFSHGMGSPEDDADVLDRFPVVLFAHNHSATCISGSRAHAFPVLRPCDKPFGPACLVHYFPRRCGGWNPITMIELYRRANQRVVALSRYTAVVVASRYMASVYGSHGVPAERLHLAPLFPTGQTLGPAPRERPLTGRILFLGRLYRDKGTLLAVEAVVLASKWLGRPLTLVVGGEGPDREIMEYMASRHHLSIEFHGWVGPERRAELMRGTDLLLVPSGWPEPFGLVGIEAGSLGIPAAAYNVGGIPDWLIPGISGELAPGDPPTAMGLAEALVRALSNRQHLHRISVGAWEQAHQFSREAHVSRIETILKAASLAGRQDAKTVSTREVM